MQKLIQQFKQNTLELNSLGRSLFFSFGIFATSEEKHGIKIDLNAMRDPKRATEETIKVIYLCGAEYAEKGRILGLECEDMVSIDHLRLWVELAPEAFRMAVDYIHRQMEDLKKKAATASSVSQPQGS